MEVFLADEQVGFLVVELSYARTAEVRSAYSPAPQLRNLGLPTLLSSLLTAARLVKLCNPPATGLKRSDMLMANAGHASRKRIGPLD